MKKYLYLLGIIAIPVLGTTQDLSRLITEDQKLNSGEVIWNVGYEVFASSSDVPIEHKPEALSVEEFHAWNAKQKGYRSQNYEVSAKFKGNHVQFDCVYDRGDVNPVEGMQSVCYGGESIAVIDHLLQNMYREVFNKNFIESAHTSLLVSPRFCGYSVNEILKFTATIKGSAGLPLSVSTAAAGTNSIRTKGIFSNGEVTLAEFTPADPDSGFCSVIKFINPGNNERVVIENSEWVAYEDGTIFPSKTVITRYLGGDLENLANTPKIDRKTLTVEYAQFNQNVPDEVFNPTCPEGYTDLGNSEIASS